MWRYCGCIGPKSNEAKETLTDDQYQQHDYEVKSLPFELSTIKIALANKSSALLVFPIKTDACQMTTVHIV
jgi:hypothetical protein